MSRKPSVRDGTTVHCARCTAPIFRVAEDGVTVEFKCNREGCGEWHQLRAVIGFVRGSYAVPHGQPGLPRAPEIDVTERRDGGAPRPYKPPFYPPDGGG